MKRFFKILSLLLVISLFGCYDMEYEDLDEYYDVFDNTVYLLYADNDGKGTKSKEVNLDDHFYNKGTQDDFDEDSLIDAEYYCYLAVKNETDENMSVSEVCVYLRAEEETSVEVRTYVVDELPDSIRGFNDEVTASKKYKDDYINPYATSINKCRLAVFKDFFIKSWNVNDTKVGTVTLKPDQYFLIQFYNNTGYGKDAGLNSVKFTMTNLIINRVTAD